jgi:PemK-like, MazF-like toxin of type II toxin-antitoxin system
MKLPVPRPGFVIRYSYLWHSEAAAGREEGIKDRPCAVVLTTDTGRGQHVVTVLPVTHTQPRDLATAIEIPGEVKRRLRLDEKRSWIVFDEANRFKWPGHDLRPLPGKPSTSISYGPLPPAFFSAVLDRFIAALEAKKSRVVART